jgi:hypothetical protein
MNVDYVQQFVQHWVIVVLIEEFHLPLFEVVE